MDTTSSNPNSFLQRFLSLQPQHLQHQQQQQNNSSSSSSSHPLSYLSFLEASLAHLALTTTDSISNSLSHTREQEIALQALIEQERLEMRDVLSEMMMLTASFSAAAAAAAKGNTHTHTDTQTNTSLPPPVMVPSTFTFPTNPEELLAMVLPEELPLPPPPPLPQQKQQQQQQQAHPYTQAPPPPQQVPCMTLQQQQQIYSRTPSAAAPSLSPPSSSPPFQAPPPPQQQRQQQQHTQTHTQAPPPPPPSSSPPSPAPPPPHPPRPQHQHTQTPPPAPPPPPPSSYAPRFATAGELRSREKQQQNHRKRPLGDGGGVNEEGGGGGRPYPRPGGGGGNSHTHTHTHTHTHMDNQQSGFLSSRLLGGQQQGGGGEGEEDLEERGRRGRARHAGGGRRGGLWPKEGEEDNYTHILMHGGGGGGGGENYHHQQQQQQAPPGAGGNGYNSRVMKKFVPPTKTSGEGNNGNGSGPGGIKGMVNRALNGPANGGRGQGGSGQGQKQGQGGGGGGDDDNDLPEELKGCDPLLVERIQNEILDSGDPVTFDDIAGLKFAKKCVMELICWPMARPDIFKGLRALPKGLLLFGPPGTGKTLLGKAIAHQSGATFFNISASSLTSKWIGEGEKLVRTLFKVAALHQPSIVFIDEVDSLLCQRSSDDNEASRRLKTEFLVQLDGCGSSAEDRILVVGATNRPQELDEAARRRFVKRLYIPLPDAEARQALVTLLLKNESHRLTAEDIRHIVGQTRGFSGADIKALCTEAAMGPVRDLLPGDIRSISAEEVPPILVKHFRQALASIRPSVSEKDLGALHAWNDEFGTFPREGGEEVEGEQKEGGEGGNGEG